MMIVLGWLAAGAAAEEFSPLAVDDSAGPMPRQEAYLADGAGYEDESLSIRIETMRAYDTTVTVARVKVSDPSQIRTAMAGRYGSSEVVLPDRLAKRCNAVLAINGDFFSYRSTGYLVRQGKLYRDRAHEDYDLLIIDDQGDFHIIQDPTAQSAHAFEGTIVNSFNFGPALIVDGEKVLPVKRINNGSTKKTQRMGIAQTGPLSYLCVATEGPENEESVGLTLEEFVELTASLGAQTAYNLDGGSSSAMMLGGRKINALSSGKMRPVCDILYFATLIPQE